MSQESTFSRFTSILKEDKDVQMEASMVGRDLINLTTAALERSGNPRLSKAVAIGSTAFTVGSALKGLYDIYRRSVQPKSFVIKITEDDDIFETVEDWFMASLPEESQLSIYAYSITEKDNENPDQERVEIRSSFDGTIAQHLTIAGHTVQVFTQQPEGSMLKYESSGSGRGGGFGSRSINIVCPTVKARNDILREIEKESQHLVESQPRMYTSDRWGGMRRRSEIQQRSRESVVLKEGQMDRILTHLNTFLSNGAAYRKADIPFRTGILLYGAPGSGKSSTALAIANELKMNVYIVTLSSLNSDDALNECFMGIPANSIIILEDIDVLSAVRDRDDDQGVTMSGMLNVLDGFQSPPGVITIMTTNRRDVLDKAIIRPGRVDLQEELGCLDTYQLEGICQYFMGSVPKGLPKVTPEDGISSAEVMGVIRKHLPDFENAAEDMVKFITKRTKKKKGKKSKNDNSSAGRNGLTAVPDLPAEDGTGGDRPENVERVRSEGTSHVLQDGKAGSVLVPGGSTRSSSSKVRSVN